MSAAMSRIQLGHNELRKGEAEKARQELSQGLAVAQANALNLPMLRVFSNLGMAFASLQQRDLAQADRHRQAMEEASAPERLTDRVALLRVHVWMACQRGQWELAFTLAEQHLAIARQCALFVVMFECHILVAYLCAQTGRVARMEEQLAEIEQLIAGTAFEKLRYQCHLARAYRALLAGESAECHRLLELGLSGSTTDEGKFMLRMQPLVLPRLLAEALRAGIQRGYVLQLISGMHVPAPPEAGEDWPWPIRVYTLGRFEVQLQGRPLEFSRKAPKKTLALLKAIIALGGVNVREQRLLDTFWPDEEGDVAARSLTAALHRLRGLLEDPDAVIQQGGVLSLDGSRVWVDALALDARLSGEARIDAGTLLQLYRGSFLREDEGEPWSVTTRERLRSRFIHALGAETARLEQAGKFALAIECYLRGIDADPVIEPFYQGLMRCYARDGRRSEAVATYRRLRHILSVTLALKPSVATERLYQELRLD
jgi:DNA-binding SARP family transcriptional activator